MSPKWHGVVFNFFHGTWVISHCNPVWNITYRWAVRNLDLQYNGSNDDLDWRIYFRYRNLIFIMKYLRSRLIKSCSIEWMHLRLLNLNLWLDLIKTSFFKVLTNFIRSGEKFYIIWEKKKSAQLDHFYRFYASFKLYPDINLHNFCLLKIAIIPVKIVRLSWFFFSKLYKIFCPI